MNIHDIRTASMLIGQLQNIISINIIADKEKKIREKGGLTATIIERIANSATAAEHLRAQATSLRNATAKPNNYAEVSAIANAIDLLLKKASQPVTAPSESEKNPRAIEPLFYQDSEIIDIIEANPLVDISKMEPMPGLFRQATRLAQRVLDGVYGDELRERLCDALISPEDFWLLLLLDSVYHNNELGKIELFTNCASEKELSHLQDLHTLVHPTKIADVILGKEDKSTLPESDLWLKIVAAAYKGRAHEFLKAIIAHTHSFYRPTPTQLVKILFTCGDTHVKEAVHRFIEKCDAEEGTKVTTLLSALKKESGEEAFSLIRALTSQEKLAFARSLALAAAHRPAFVLSVIENYYKNRKGFLADSGYEQEHNKKLLTSLWLTAGKVAIEHIASKDGIDSAQVHIDNIQEPLAKDLAQAAFFETFRTSHPAQALNMLFSRIHSSIDPTPQEQIQCFITGKTAKEAFSFWPATGKNESCKRLFLRAILVQALKRNVEEAVAFVQEHPDIVLENLGRYFRHIDNYEVSLKTRLIFYSQIVDENVRSCFLYILFPRLTDDSTTFDEISDEECNALLANIPTKERNQVASHCALAYVGSGTKPEIETAFSLLSTVSEQKMRGTGLHLLVAKLHDLPDGFLDTSSILHYIGRALAEASTCDEFSTNEIRVSMVKAMIKDPLQIPMAIQFAREEMQDTRTLGDALGYLTNAVISQNPKDPSEFKSLVLLANSGKRQHCLEAVFTEIINHLDRAEEMLPRLLEYVSPEKKDAMRLWIVEDFLAGVDGSGYSFIPDEIVAVAEGITADVLPRLTTRVLKMAPKDWPAPFRFLALLATHKGEEGLKTVVSHILREDNSEALNLFLKYVPIGKRDEICLWTVESMLQEASSSYFSILLVAQQIEYNAQLVKALGSLTNAIMSNPPPESREVLNRIINFAFRKTEMCCLKYDCKRLFLRAILVQALKRNVEEAVAFVQEHPDIIREHIMYFRHIDNYDVSLKTRLTFYSQIVDEDVRRHFLNILFPSLTDDSTTFDEISAEECNALLANIPTKERNQVATHCALAFVGSGTKPEIETAFSLLSTVSEQEMRGNGLRLLAASLIPNEFLDTSSTLDYIVRALAEASTCDEHSANQIRISMVKAMIKDPLQIPTAIQFAREQIQDTKTLGLALGNLTRAVIRQNPKDPSEFKSLVLLANSGEKQHCLEAVFTEIINHPGRVEMLPRLLEYVSPEKNDAMRLWIVEDFLAGADGSGYSFIPDAIVAVAEGIIADVLPRLTTRVLMINPKYGPAPFRFLALLVNSKGEESLKTVVSQILREKNSEAFKLFFKYVRDDKSDAIHLLVVESMLQEASLSYSSILLVVQQIQNSELLAEALGSLTNAIMSNPPPELRYVMSLILNFAFRKTEMCCLKSVLCIIAKANKTKYVEAILKKIELLSPEKAAVLRKELAESTEAPRPQGDDLALSSSSPIMAYELPRRPDDIGLLEEEYW